MDVADWLRALGLEQYEAAFRENDVGGEILPDLTADDLKDLGITSLGHRRQLLERSPRCGLKARRLLSLASRPARLGTRPRSKPPPNAARSA